MVENGYTLTELKQNTNKLKFIEHETLRRKS
jgi:hypothetical protein